MYHLGETPELKNYFVAAGFNSIGIQSAGGAGMALAAWMDDGYAPMDLWDVDIRRMMPFQNDKSYLFERSKETPGLLYADRDHVLEAGLGFAVKSNKLPSRFGEFIGKDAVLRKKETGLTRRLLQFKLRDPEPLTYHNEPILRDGKTIGYLTSGSYGHILGGAMGLGYIPCALDEKLTGILASNFEIVVAGERFEADASAARCTTPAQRRFGYNLSSDVISK